MRAASVHHTSVRGTDEPSRGMNDERNQPNATYLVFTSQSTDRLRICIDWLLLISLVLCNARRHSCQQATTRRVTTSRHVPTLPNPTWTGAGCRPGPSRPDRTKPLTYKSIPNADPISRTYNLQRMFSCTPEECETEKNTRLSGCHNSPNKYTAVV